ncbi:MAG: flagellar basal body-associated FliL family protein [Pseudomonadota bacterium]
MADQDAKDAPKGNKKMIIIVALVAVVAAGAGVAVPMLLNKPEPVAAAQPAEEEAVATGEDAIYEGIHPPLLINFLDERGKGRFLQISLEVMTRQQSVVDAIKAHNAVIRNNLILLYGEIKLADVNTRDGKTEMLAQALTEINSILKQQTGEEGVEAVYFTNLVVQ